MQRRKFIQQSGAFAVGIGVFGNVRWATDRFEGDTPTTTDVLGPFYRPGAPIRTNLNPPDFRGEVVHFSGTVMKSDGKTPVPDCLVEIWQCNPDGLYDNISDEFQYRASQKTGTDGTYRFVTSMPIPYATEENPNVFRPAHIHMRLSANGLQDLITQVYLQGDPHLNTDPSTQSAFSVNRILPVRKIKEHESAIRFDVALKNEYLPDAAVFRKVCGVYRMNDKSMMEFYRSGDLLFLKWNNQIWGSFFYGGNNTFTGGNSDMAATFELLPKGQASVQFRIDRRRKVKLEGTKVLDYQS